MTNLEMGQELSCLRSSDVYDLKVISFKCHFVYELNAISSSYEALPIGFEVGKGR